MSNHCYPNEVNKSHNVYTMYFTNWFNYDSIMKTFFRYEFEVQCHRLLLIDISIYTLTCFVLHFKKKSLHWLSWEVWISVLTVTEPSVVHTTQVIKIKTETHAKRSSKLVIWYWVSKAFGDHVCLKLHLIHDCLPMIKASNIVLHLASTVNRWIVSVWCKMEGTKPAAVCESIPPLSCQCSDQLL